MILALESLQYVVCMPVVNPSRKLDNNDNKLYYLAVVVLHWSLGIIIIIVVIVIIVC